VSVAVPMEIATNLGLATSASTLPARCPAARSACTAVSATHLRRAAAFATAELASLEWSAARRAFTTATARTQAGATLALQAFAGSRAATRRAQATANAGRTASALRAVTACA